MDLDSLDPSRAYCDTCQIYLSATYETLVPRLATDWSNGDRVTEPVLVVDDLHVTFPTAAGDIRAVRGVSLEVHEGESLAEPALAVVGA